MRKFMILFRHQIWQMAISPSTYFAAFLFLFFMAVAFLLAVRDVGLVPSKNSPVETFLSVFWVPVLFMVPLLTMRSLSDELRRGTLSSLLTTAVSAWQVVLSKFLASYLFYALIWLSTPVFVVISCAYIPHATAGSFFEVSQLVSGYGFVLLTGAMYVAVGIFSSSLTRTTLVACMLSFGMLFFLIIGAGLAESLPVSDGAMSRALHHLVEHMHTFRQLDDFNNAVVDSRAFFFYVSSTLMLLAMTSLITESKNR